MSAHLETIYQPAHWVLNGDRKDKYIANCKLEAVLNLYNSAIFLKCVTLKFTAQTALLKFCQRFMTCTNISCYQNLSLRVIFKIYFYFLVLNRRLSMLNENCKPT